MGIPVLGGLFSGGSGLGFVFSSLGSVLQGINQARQMKAQAAIARAQAKQHELLAEYQRRNALMASEQGGLEAQAQDRKNRLIAAQQLAAMGASGVEVSSPSFLQARAGLLKIAAEEGAAIVETRQKESYNFRMAAQTEEHNAAIQRASAQMYEDAADAAMFSGFLGAMTSIIGAAGSAPASVPALRSFSTFRPRLTSVPIPRPRPFTIMRG